MSGFVGASSGHSLPCDRGAIASGAQTIYFMGVGHAIANLGHWVIYNNESGPSFAIVLLSRPPQI